MSNEPSQLQPAPPKQRSIGRRLVPALLVLLAAPVAILYGNIVIDTVKAAQFKPSTQIAAISTRLGLNARAERTFYATAPVIEEKTQFNNDCKSTERTAAILGCYYKDRIYLYNIQDTELDGTLEVTAAHEMLHAAYQRLNFIERQQVDTMVQAEYQQIKDMAAIKQVMAYYSQAEPGDEVNELHSIIGTTVSNLTPELESYYGQYFKNRASVVALNAKYNDVFGKLNDEASALQKKIDSEGPLLKTDLATYATDLEQLNLDIESFNERAQSGGFGSQGAFAVARATLLTRVDALNARHDALNTRVDAYNANIEALNKLSVKANELNESLNGVSSPAGV